jgi:hypothetical protein
VYTFSNAGTACHVSPYFFQVVGSMNIDAQSLMLTTLVKSLTSLGYEVEVCFLTTPFYPAC